MKSTQSALRVSHLTYIRVMDAVVSEVAALDPAEAVAVINAVVAYLHCADGVSSGDNEILRRYFDIIDRAALRSARARQAALN
ncbi:MAG: hypothetical protein K2H87_04690, partial [Duncaniella sp.]|nr:hypothetical protein [Duncaniella sp.]